MKNAAGGTRHGLEHRAHRKKSGGGPPYQSMTQSVCRRRANARSIVECASPSAARQSAPARRRLALSFVLDGLPRRNQMKAGTVAFGWMKNHGQSCGLFSKAGGDKDSTPHGVGHGRWRKDLSRSRPPPVERRPIASNTAPRKRFGLAGDFGGWAASII